MLGYKNQSSASQIWWILDKRVVISRHVKFDESCFPALTSSLSLKPTNNQYPVLPQNISDYFPDIGEAAANKDDVCSALEDQYHDAVEEQPSRRIGVIGPRHPTIITGDISSENILPYRRREHVNLLDMTTYPKRSQEIFNIIIH
ncbi:hypothetical protein O181_111434 [Austropuccinia psidii MF-1]|uniref:Retroviral polymerase SH3-like domain-containing protein n=1 Tax=Austropuccinia psidii MF-1 TaxID=1389203 RepID=A0A9Q3K1Z3_9BASI|nr:hypothetical protein [Austropuccinia psidii MF-1]